MELKKGTSDRSRAEMSEKNSLGPATGASPGFAIQDWGLIPYQEALRRQLDLVGLVSHELARETLVFCSHPPVVTLGRGTRPGDVFGWDGEVVEVTRGGRATYHGPSQVVAYPILDLNLRGRDVHRHMRLLESAVIEALSEFGAIATGRAARLEADGAQVEATGVWIGDRKIASIGIGVRRWVSFHGLALNVERDPAAFRGLKPCGFTPETMISLEEAIGRPVDRAQVQKALFARLARLLGI
jgi:lipoate-protein ligase B